MKIISEMNLSDFEAWSGAIGTFERIEEENKINELEIILDDLYPEGMTDTQLNDLLWFDSEWLFEMLGISEEEEEEEEN